MERNTRQRGAIRHAFQRTERPLSAREVHEAARHDVAPLGLATVYRGIRALLEEGWLAPVSLPDGPPRYERAGKGHHHHFHCISCDRVFDVACHLTVPAEALPTGFHLDTHHLYLTGTCRDCETVTR